MHTIFLLLFFTMLQPLFAMEAQEKQYMELRSFYGRDRLALHSGNRIQIFSIGHRRGLSQNVPYQIIEKIFVDNHGTLWIHGLTSSHEGTYEARAFGEIKYDTLVDENFKIEDLTMDGQEVYII